MTVTMFMQGRDIGHPAAFDYDMMPDLMAINVKGLILTDVQDVVHENDLRAATVRPDFTLVEFSKEGPDAMMLYPERWAKIVSSWVTSRELDRPS